MIPTLDLSELITTWRDIIIESEAINNFCQEKYQKQPTVFVGMNGAKLPDKKFCPFIAILPGMKIEGPTVDKYLYAIPVAWSVYQPNVLVDGEQKKWAENISGDCIEFIGTYESGSLGQLIYTEIQNAVEDIFAIGRLDLSIELQENAFPQWPGFMVLTTEIEPAMQENLTYQGG